MTEAYMQLVYQVNLARRLWRARRVVEGLMLALAAGACAMVVAALLDRLGSPGAAGRWLLGAGMWGAVAASFWFWAARPARAVHTDDFFAALLEKRLPALGNRLINALQLGRKEEPQAPKIVETIVADGAEAALAIDPADGVSDPAMRRNALVLAGAVAAAFLYLGVSGPAARTSFMRVLLPGARIAPFSWTTLSVDIEPGRRVLEGTRLETTASTRGRMPGKAQLYWSDAGGRGQSLRMAQAGTGRFAHVFPSVEAPFSFHVTAGDARSETFRIAVDRRPRVDSMSVTYDYPAYTGMAQRRIEEFDGHLSGLTGTRAVISFKVDKELERLSLGLGTGGGVDGSRAGADATTWSAELTLERPGTYQVRMEDYQGYSVEVPAVYTITVTQDSPPVVVLVRPGRDLQRRPGDTVGFAVVAQDDFGLGPVRMLGRKNSARTAAPIHAWPNEGKPERRAELDISRTVEELGLASGDRLEYWAEALDRKPGSPGKAETRKFYLTVLSADQAAALLQRNLADYSRVIRELIRVQRLNRAETAEGKPGAVLVKREGLVRRQLLQLADVMVRNSFPGRSIIDELRALAAGPVAEAVVLLEAWRDASDPRAGRASADRSLPVQDNIIRALEQMLVRLDRNEQTRRYIRKVRKEDPVEHKEVTGVLAKIAEELDGFLREIREIEEKYEKMPKDAEEDELSSEELAALDDIEHRMDRWKKWFKDSVDAIAKLPDGFVAEDFLADTFSTIFEEIEKQPRPATTEIATPVEEGVKALAETVAEDLEMWMPDAGDSIRWVMEDPVEGAFEVPEAPLPSSLQDMIGDLIEDLEEFDEAADDVTGAWGGNMQVGWAIMDGPISSYYAAGKTGNQLPNASEMGGRSGSGRRGRSSGQMVGATSRALEGRPTPARLTGEAYEAGIPEAEKQLDPRGATGGGKKTGGGKLGLQGGTPPDFVKDMERLAENQAMLREKVQQVARKAGARGRPLPGIDRAIELMEGAEQDYRDLRYDDAARKRKTALEAVRRAGSSVDQAVTLSLEHAKHLPPELRREISAGSQQALPEGYEDIVGAYYRELSRHP